MTRVLRWKVAVVDDHERSRAVLRAAVWSAGGEVVGEAMRRVDAVPMVRRTGPDVVVLAVGLPDGDGIEAAAAVATTLALPAVLHTSHAGADVGRRASAAGVVAYLLKPLRAAEVGPTLDIAVARFQELRRLRGDLEARKLIERAKGVVMARFQLTEEDAFRRLRRMAMDTRRPLRDVARAVLISESLVDPAPETR